MTSESRADSPPSACSFDNDRNGVFNIAKEAGSAVTSK